MSAIEIRLDNLKFHAFHGVAPQEKRVGAEFEVDVKIYVMVTEGIVNDTLCGTVSYADVYDVVREEMDKPSDLIENVAIRICRAVGRKFPQVFRACVEVRKIAPPVPGMIGSSAVRYKEKFY